MSSPDFCDLLSTTFKLGWVTYTAGHDYVLRMILDGWEVQTPAASRLISVATAVADLPATCNQLGQYQVKSVLLRKIDQGQTLKYFEKTSYSSGCSGTLTAGDGTWVIDLVFRSSVDERSWSGVDTWKEWISNALAGNRGKPIAYVGGIVDLYEGGDSNSAYASAVSFWASKQPYWEIIREGKSDITPFYKVSNPSAINKSAPLVAWANFPLMGQDGVGIGIGDAFDPNNIQPLAVAGTTTPANSNVPINPDDPSTWPVGPDASLLSWDTLSTTQKGVAIAGGLLAGWAVGKFVLRW